MTMVTTLLNQNYLARSYVARAQSCVSQNVTLLRLLNFGKEPARKADG